MAITAKDLPATTAGSVVFDMNDGETIQVSRRADGTFYGFAPKFDCEGTASEMVDKLNRWGARVAGWEN